jgi:hypothetical protein
MANKFTNFLGGVINSKNQLKDYQHASRLYVDDYYRLSPKTGFLYYVVFNINRNNNPIIQEYLAKNGREVGLLVKSTDLPKFRVTTETLNQYNRKTIVQTKIDYQPVNMIFHDDMTNVTTGLWKAYFNYYYADGKNYNGLTTPPSFGDTKYNTIGASVNESTTYGLNNGQTGPFFSSIEIYQLNRKQFTAHILINPIITAWEHDRVDQSSSAGLENKMTVGYETVLYGTGKVKSGVPTGFATFHYDSTPGPLSIFGSGNSNLFGAGGIINGANELFNSDTGGGLVGALQTVRGAKNLLGNVKNATRSSILSEAKGVLTGGLLRVAAGGSFKSPANLQLTTLPGEKPTTAVPKKSGGTSGASLTTAVNDLNTKVSGAIDKIGSTIKGILPSSASVSGSAALAAIKEDQMLLADSINSQIATNQLIKDEMAPQIAAAKAANDVAALDAIYNNLDAMGYTDPSKLVDSLTQVNQNIADLNTKISQASATETPNNTLSIDSVPSGISQEDVYNVAANPDLNKQTGQVYVINTGSTSQYYV